MSGICHYFIKTTAMRHTRENNILGAALFLATFLFFASFANGVSLGRVMGGRDAEEGAYPYQASLRIDGFHKCGGSLVNDRWVLTAAHCLLKCNNPYDITVVLGTNDLVSGGVAFYTEDVRVYPLYAKGGSDNDIGLIKIMGRVEFTDAIMPIKLPMTDVDETDCVATFTGWGNTVMSVPNHKDLQVIELTVMDTESCHSIFSTVGRGHLCTLTVAGEGVCYGDSGSPLVSNGTQIAIASWVAPCARGYPDVHTRVYEYTPWILSVIETNAPNL